MKPKYQTSKLRNTRTGASLITAITFCIGSVASVNAATWLATGTSDWNTNTNWSGGAGTGGSNAVISVPGPPTATISANIPATPVDILVGDGSGLNGHLIHNAGNANTGNGNWMVVGRGTGTGVYDLANTAGTGGTFTGFGTGSGSMKVGNATGTGRLYVGVDAGSIGTVNVNTSGTLASSNDLVIGENGGIGTFNLDSGTVTNGGWNFIGRGGSGAGVGNYNQSGGTLTNTGRTYVGSGNSVGHFNMTGGTHTANGEFSLGSGNLVASAPSTLTLSGGTLNTGKCAIGGNALAEDTGKGTATISGTATLNVNGEFWVGQGTGSSGSLTMSGGAINVNNWVAIGRGGGPGTVNMSGGTITKNGGGNFIIGAGAPGTMTMTGGLVNVTSGIFWAAEGSTCVLDVSGTAEIRTSVMTLAANGGSTGTVGLDGGTLKTTQITGGGGTAEMDFNGGQIIATAAQANFITNLDVANIEAGGMKIDSNGFNLSTAQVISGTGGLTKSGAGTLKLNGANTYAGDNIVSAGKLYANNQSTGTGNFTIADGTGLGITSVDDFSQLTSGTVTFGTSAATTLDFDLGSFFGNPSAASLKVTNLIANGTVTIHIADASPDVGTIPLIEYTSKTLNGSGAFVLGTLPLGVVATLQDTGTAINLVVTSVALPRWDGSVVGGIWDVNTTANWVDQISNLTSTYKEGNPVLFDDLLSGTPDVVLNTTVNPGSVTFANNVASYTLTGTGKISGTIGLQKTGSGTLTLGIANDYSGSTTLGAGVTSVSTLANGGLPSPIGGSSSSPSNLVFAGGTLSYTGASTTVNRGYSVTAANSAIDVSNPLTDLNLSGSVTATAGAFAKIGEGTLTLSGSGTSTFGSGGNNRVDVGKLVLNGTGTSPAQVINQTGDIWVGSIPTTGASMDVINTTLNVSAWLAVGRGNGDIGNTASVSLTGSNVTVGNLSLGYDNGLPNLATQYLTLTNSTLTNNGNTNFAERRGSTANVVLIGNSVLSLHNRLLLGDGGGVQAGGSVANLTIGDSSSVIVGSPSSPAFTSIGYNGGGNLTVKNNGSFTNYDDFSVNENGSTPSSVTLQDNGAISVGIVYVGRNTNVVGTVNQTGGTFTGGNDNTFQIGGSGVGTWNQSGGIVNAGGWIAIGRNNVAGASGALNVSGGTFNQTTTARNIIVGEETTGVLTVSATGTVSASSDNGILIANGATGNGTIHLDGGSIITKSVHEGVAGTSTFNFNGGLLKAATGATAAFLSNVDNVVVKAGGARIDSNGNNISANTALLDGGTGGGLTKSGAGALYLNGPNTYTGATSVTAGTLGGTGTIAGSVSVAAGANLAPGVTTGTLTVGSATFAATATLTVDIAAAADTLAVTSNLNLSNATLVINGTPTLPTYVIASYGSLTGTFASVPTLPAGYSINYNYNGLKQIAITAASDPYQTWAQANITAINPGADATAEGDPDGDGVKNITEFALDGNPLSGASTGKMVGKIASVGGAPALVLTLPVRTGATFSGTTEQVSGLISGVIYKIQASDELGAWNLAVSEVTGTDKTAIESGLPGLSSSEWTYRTFRSPGSISGDPAEFMRAVILNP